MDEEYRTRFGYSDLLAAGSGVLMLDTLEYLVTPYLPNRHHILYPLFLQGTLEKIDEART